jgi:hypothetical protein
MLPSVAALFTSFRRSRLPVFIASPALLAIRFDALVRPPLSLRSLTPLVVESPPPAAGFELLAVLHVPCRALPLCLLLLDRSPLAILVELAEEEVPAREARSPS